VRTVGRFQTATVGHEALGQHSLLDANQHSLMLARLAFASTPFRSRLLSTAATSRPLTDAESAVIKKMMGGFDKKEKMGACFPGARFPMFFVSSFIWNGLAGYGIYSLLTRNSNSPELVRQEAELTRAHERAIEEMRLKYKFGGTVVSPELAQATTRAMPSEIIDSVPAPSRAVESTE